MDKDFPSKKYFKKLTELLLEVKLEAQNLNTDSNLVEWGQKIFVVGLTLGDLNHNLTVKTILHQLKNKNIESTNFKDRLEILQIYD